MEQERLISHIISPKTVESTTQRIKERIRKQGDKPYTSVQDQIAILDQLNQFEFGQYLLQNQGINGYWTHYMLTHPWFGRKTGKNNRGEPLSKLESFLLDHAPTMLATQQRFEIFLRENQKRVKNYAKLACIPSGMMGELLYLDYKNIENIELTGIDYDSNTLNDAKLLAEKKGLANFIQLVQQDAWKLSFQDEFDLISSNGLNIYEPDKEKVKDLYRQFYKALKPGGQLVTSFLTYPPNLTTKCEWELSEINQGDLLTQKIIFVDIIEAKFQCYCSSEETDEQLRTAGFKNIEFIYDKAKMFPTVIAYKQ
ncbi:Exported protein [Legionella busanensis]|uniref:Exported protein n=1 Tax=Legionella busanensis TaxID=190655 RepID=A0A378KEC1_9GAMM|nr:class I SAM-dependent methyltransferase [Legionella busanensis]STX81592.1 Exported protein [Legionella busanensis]